MPLLLLGAFLWALVPATVGYESCLQLLAGMVGAGNYTYYRLSHEGDVSLILRSSEGDADVYVSQHNLQPTYELDTHDLQSVTCGDDLVEIPSSFKRPVSIGIYGHPSYDVSVYQLCVNFLTSNVVMEYEYDYNSYPGEDSFQDKPSRPPHPLPYSKDDGEEQSLIWAILIGILKVFVEVLM